MEKLREIRDIFSEDDPKCWAPTVGKVVLLPVTEDGVDFDLGGELARLLGASPNLEWYPAEA